MCPQGEPSKFRDEMETRTKPTVAIETHPSVSMATDPVFFLQAEEVWLIHSHCQRSCLGVYINEISSLFCNPDFLISLKHLTGKTNPLSLCLPLLIEKTPLVLNYIKTLRPLKKTVREERGREVLKRKEVLRFNNRVKGWGNVGLMEQRKKMRALRGQISDQERALEGKNRHVCIWRWQMNTEMESGRVEEFVLKATWTPLINANKYLCYYCVAFIITHYTEEDECLCWCNQSCVGWEILYTLHYFLINSLKKCTALFFFYVLSVQYH